MSLVQVHAYIDSILVTNILLFIFVFLPSIDRTTKMYIGGAQKRPDATYSRAVLDASGKALGNVGEGNRKDVREAVEAAFKAAPG